MKQWNVLSIDDQLTNKLANDLNVSIIYQGGISSVQDIIDAINAGANSIAIGSYFIFYGKFNSVLISYLSENNGANISRPNIWSQ